MRKLCTLLILIASSASAANLDVRHYYITNDVSSARSAVAPLVWYAGESVNLDLYVRRDSTPVDLSASGLYPRWEAFMDSDHSTAYIMYTGTVANATNGYVTFVLTPELANLPAATYVSYIKLYQPVNGTNTYVGMAYKATTRVDWSPSATNFTYQGPYTNAQAPITSLIAGTGIALSPTNGYGAVTISASGGGSVTSVNGYTGVVVIAADDLADFQAAVSTNADVVANIAKISYPAADSNKLAGIAAGATSNSTDAVLLARANHTGTQTSSTISDFDSSVGTNALVAAAVQPGDNVSDLVNDALYLTDSPSNGSQYARQDGAWAVVAGGGGGGGTVTNLPQYMYLNPSVEFADNPSPATTNNALISRTVKIGSFPVASDAWSDMVWYHTEPNWAGLITVRGDWWTDGTTNLTATWGVKCYDALGASYLGIVTGGQETVQANSAITNRQRLSAVLDLSGLVTTNDGGFGVRFGWEGTNAVNGDTRTGTILQEMFSGAVVY